MNDIKKVLIAAICVVLVVAIAAGVSIGVLAGTVNGLKDTVAELQQANEAQASLNASMKAEIEAAKNNEELVTAAEFEAKLAEALGAQTQTMQALITTAVKNQIEELGVEGLTEAQVQTIIDAAVENCLTEDDIDAIIADLDTGLTKDEVKKLINNANAGYLTYAQIVNLIEDESYALRKFLEDKLEVDLGNLGESIQNGQTISLDVNASEAVNGKVVLDEDELDKLFDGGEIYLKGNWADVELVINYDTAKDFDIVGGTSVSNQVTLKKLTVTMPKSEINIYYLAILADPANPQAPNVVVNWIASNSLVFIGCTIGNIEVNEGHVELGEDTEVTNVTLKDGDNKLTVTENATVTSVTVENTEGKTEIISENNNTNVTITEGTATVSGTIASVTLGAGEENEGDSKVIIEEGTVDKIVVNKTEGEATVINNSTETIKVDVEVIQLPTTTEGEIADGALNVGGSVTTDVNVEISDDFKEVVGEDVTVEDIVTPVEPEEEGYTQMGIDAPADADEFVIDDEVIADLADGGTLLLKGEDAWADIVITIDYDADKDIVVEVDTVRYIINEVEDKASVKYDFVVEARVSTAAELIAAVKEDDKVIVLQKDITLEEALVIKEGIDVVIDLNGNTITAAVEKAEDATICVINNEGTLTLIGEGTIGNTEVNGAAVIYNIGALTLDGVTIEGAPIGETAEIYPEYAIKSSGDLVVEEGTIVTSDRGALRLDGTGTTVINGGTFASNDVNITGGLTSHVVLVEYGAKNQLTINAGNFEHRYAETSGGVVVNNWSATTIIVNGGNFSGGNYFGKWDNLSDYGYGMTKKPFSVTGGTFTGIDTNYVAEGYVALEDGDNYVVLPAGSAIANSVDAFTAALKEGATNIILKTGTYNIPSAAKGKTFTLTGMDKVVIEIVPAGQGEANGQLDYNLDGSTVTFNNVTIKSNNNTYAGYARLTATFNNCVFENHFCLNRTSTFNDCVFNVTGNQYNLWTWGADFAEFNRCEFNCDGKAVMLYGTANTKLVLTDCVFNDNGDIADKAAIEIGNDYNKSYELIINNIKVNGFDINPNGASTGTEIWANKNSMTTDKLNVVIDGKDVY